MNDRLERSGDPRYGQLTSMALRGMVQGWPQGDYNEVRLGIVVPCARIIEWHFGAQELEYVVVATNHPNKEFVSPERFMGAGYTKSYIPFEWIVSAQREPC